MRKMIKYGSLIFVLSLFAAVIGLMASSASAATYNWTSSSSGNWSSGGSWDAPPVSAIDTIIQFNTPGTYIANHDLANGFLLNQLNFGGATVTLAGNSLAFTNAGAQINQNGSTSVTIGNTLSLATNLTFGGSGTGLVTVTGFIGTGSATGSLTHAGGGVLYLANTNNGSFNGGIIVSNATLKATCGSTANAFGAGAWSGPQIVLYNSTLIFDGGGWLGVPILFSGTNTLMAATGGNPYLNWGGLMSGTGKIIVGGANGMAFCSRNLNYTCDVVIAQAPGGYILCGDPNASGSFGYGPLTFASTNGVRLGVNNSNGAGLRNNPVILQTNLWYFGNYGNNQFYMYGNITGPGSLGKEFDTGDSNTGLYLVGTNTYSGGTIWLSGYLRPYNTDSLGVGPVTMGGKASSSHAVTLMNMAAFTLTNNFILIGITNSGSAWNLLAQAEFNTAFNLTISGNVSGTGGLLKSGSATLTLSGANTFSGPVTQAGGTLNMNGKAFSNMTITTTSGVITNGTLANCGVTLSGGTISSDITGSSWLVVNGGQTYLYGANTFTGGTVIDAGSVSFMKTDSMPVSGTITVASGATLGLGVAGAGCFGSSDLDALFAGTMTNVSMAAGSLVGIDTTLGDAGYGSSIPATTLGLNKLGVNTLTLSGVNTYSGQTMITAGRLLLSAANAIPAGGAVNVAGGTFDLGGSSPTVGAVTMSSGAITNGTLNGSSYTFSGGTVYASLAGSGALTNISGTTTLIGGNSFNGGAVISGGTLTLNFANQTADIINNGNVLTLRGGTLNLTGKSGATDSQTFTSTTLSANRGSTITLTQNGATTMNLALGTITRNAGSTLNFSIVPLTFGIVATTSTTGDGSGILAPWLTVGTTTTLQYGTTNASQQIVSYTGATAGTAGTLANVINPNVNYSFGAAATMAVSITGNTLCYTGGAATLDNGGNTITLNGLLGAGSGGLTFNGAGNLIIGASKELVIVLNNQGAAINCPIVNNGGGASSVTFSSQGGWLTLGSSASSYTGGTTINGGGVALGVVQPAPIGYGPVVVNGGATLQLNNNGTVTNSLILNGGTLNDNNGFNSTWSGPIFLAANSTLLSWYGGPHLSGSISGPGSLTTSTRTGGEGFNFSGNNTYSGGIIHNSGVINLSHTNALGTGTLAMNGGQLTAGADLSGGTGVTNSIVLLRDGTFNINNNTLLSGSISGAGNLVKGGNSTLTLSGSNTFYGNMIVSAGKLVVNNSLALKNSTLLYNMSANTNVIFGAGITNFTLGGLAGTNNLAMTNQAGAAFNLSVGNNLGPGSTYSGVLSGSGSLTKVGGNMFTLSNTNTFTGSVTVIGGTLSVPHSLALNTNAIYLSNTATLNLNFTGTMTNYMLTIGGVARPTGTYGSNNVFQITGPGKVFTLWPPLGGLVMTLR